MMIKGIVGFSMADWDGKISCVLFLPNCNFRCPFCYNVTLVINPEKKESIHFDRVRDYLKKQKDWIDGVCITGGEPTLHSDLPNLCSKLKEMGFLIKVDTNGTDPVMIKKLIEKGLVDYVALDIKAPLTAEKYSKAVGVSAENLLEEVKKTVEILMEAKIDYEFRTTVVPTIHEKKDIEDICRSVKGCKKYVLQNFDVSLGKVTLDSEFSKLQPFTGQEMNAFLAIAQGFIPDARLR